MYQTTPFRHCADQLRLLVAETFISWALKIVPAKHPDALVIMQAGYWVAHREPCKVNWRGIR